MMKPVKILYVYDPLCGWCFGFSGVIKKLAEDYASDFEFDVISGGMIVGERAGVLAPKMAEYILSTIPRLETHTGVKFGEIYKQQIASGTLYQSSVKPSIALCVFKDHFPDKAVPFASAIQNAQFVEGKNLEDDQTYLSLITPYNIDPGTFLEQLNSEEYHRKAYEEFNYAQQLGVSGFPAVIAVHKDKYYLVSNGYQSYEQLQPVFEKLKTFE